MTVRWITTLSLGLLVAFAALGAQQRARALGTERELRSYALGMDIGNQFRKLSIDVDPAVFAKGVNDGLAGGKTLITESEAKAAIARVQNDFKNRQVLPSAAPEEKRPMDPKKAGAAFLAENGKKPGVVTLASGLQYRILVQGTGRKPILTDTVVCQYRGTLIDGTEFDSSYARRQPATLAVKGVIPGWTEALQMMPVGSKWQLFIPPELAYGTRGAGENIAPGSTLIFEVELLSIK
jgi:FKBP-type peptidyl-prolyl cis-trans isomerase FklB